MNFTLIKTLALYGLLFVGGAVGIAEDNTPPVVVRKGCAEMLVKKESILRHIANRIHFNRSQGSDFVLFVRENNFAHWQALRLLVQAEVEDAERTGGPVRSPSDLEKDPQTLSYWMRHDLWDLVMGDPHLRNIESRLFAGQYGFPEQVRIVFNDPDDAGFGPLFGDLVRLASVTLAERVEVDKLVKFYVKGLDRESMATPKVLEEFLDLKPRKFLKLQTQLFDKELKRIRVALGTQSGSYNFNQGSGHLQAQADLARVRRLQDLTGLRLLDGQGVPAAYLYTKKGGGSGGIPGDPMVTRDWLLAYNSFGMPTIIEFKPPSLRPGVQGYNPAQERSPGGRYTMALSRMYFGQPVFPKMVPWNGSFLFMRDKLLNPLKDAISEDMDLKEKEKVVQYVAHMLGDFHSRNVGDAGQLLSRSIDENHKAFQKVFDRISRQLDAIMRMGFDSSAHEAP